MKFESSFRLPRNAIRRTGRSYREFACERSEESERGVTRASIAASSSGSSVSGAAIAARQASRGETVRSDEARRRDQEPGARHLGEPVSLEAAEPARKLHHGVGRRPRHARTAG